MSLLPPDYCSLWLRRPQILPPASPAECCPFSSLAWSLRLRTRSIPDSYPAPQEKRSAAHSAATERPHRSPRAPTAEMSSHPAPRRIPAPPVHNSTPPCPDSAVLSPVPH